MCSMCPVMVINLTPEPYIFFFSFAYLWILIYLISCLAVYWYIYPLLHNQEPDVMVLVALVNLAVNTTD